VFSHFFHTIFSIFFLAIYVFLEKFFSRVFFPHFLSRYSCVYKKRVFALFPDDFFLTIFGYPNREFFEIFLFAFFPPPFFDHDIRVFIKNVISHFFQTIFYTVFCSRYTCVSGKVFLAFFPPFFGHDIRVFIKNVFSHFFETIFFHCCLLAKSVCFWKNFFFAFFPPFLVTIFMCL